MKKFKVVTGLLLILIVNSVLADQVEKNRVGQARNAAGIATNIESIKKVQGIFPIIPETVGQDMSVTLCPEKDVPQWGECLYKAGGRGPAGGVVLLVSDDGKHGIEVTGSALKGKYEWGCWKVPVTGTSDGIGHGKANTKLIMEKNCTIRDIYNVEPKYAALAAHEHTQNGFDGWFLPSLTTALKIKHELIETGIIESKDCLWTSVPWSSGSYESDTAYIIQNNSPDRNSGLSRWGDCEVFPVRDF